MKRLFSAPALFVASTFALLLVSCGSSRDPLVAELKQGEWKETITLGEFEKRYAENNRTIESAKRDSLPQYREFLERYIDFRLKVKDARDMGLDKSSDVRSELEQYRQTMAPAYLTEKEVMEDAIRTLYKRRQEEINASHLLIRTGFNSPPSDTLAAYQKIMGIKSEILSKSISFDSAAVKYSEDPSAQQNKGNLGYFTAGVMVHQFEDACYEAKKGDLVGPVRTRFGYHLIEVRDRRPREQIFVSHIMAFCTPQSSPDDTLKAYNKILDAQKRLMEGEPFADVARDMSDDRQTAVNGGDLGAVGRGQFANIAPEFEEAAFALKKKGDISPIVRTNYGYHLIQLTHKGFKSLDEERETLKSLLKRNPEKMNAEDDKLIARLKKEYLYVETPANALVLAAKADSGTTFAQVDSLNLSDKEKSAVIFSFANRVFTLDSLIRYIKDNSVGVPITRESVAEQLKAYAKQALKNHEISQLENRSPEFARLMRDYLDGILLFNASEKKVWGPAMPNDTVARPYYEAHRERYQFGERVGISQIVVSNKELADKLYEEITQGKRSLDVVTAQDVKKQTAELKRQLSRLKRKDKDYAKKREELEAKLAALKVDDKVRTFEELSKRYGQRFADDDTLKTGYVGLFQKGENKAADLAFNQPVGYVMAPTELDGAFVIARVDKREAPRAKTFEEARPEVYSQYQEETSKRLESQWISSLRAKTEISIYEEHLAKAFRFVEPKSRESSASSATAALETQN
ncbi:MAG: peptidylprolyl isomerase [Chloroherpetonaceae bacterium]|nr:peptidylprolyl isomerase [Chloroherpetonaceae bacterium]MDW8437396.1 peptidylprolyl isomerase [Chloroherpetonaceae bacterium]